MSHHLLHHKLGVMRTSIDRMEKVVTEKDDKKVEEDNQEGAETVWVPRLDG